jgi:hypothetical protein
MKLDTFEIFMMFMLGCLGITFLCMSFWIVYEAIDHHNFIENCINSDF